MQPVLSPHNPYVNLGILRGGRGHAYIFGLILISFFIFLFGNRHSHDTLRKKFQNFLRLKPNHSAKMLFLFYRFFAVWVVVRYDLFLKFDKNT